MKKNDTPFQHFSTIEYTSTDTYIELQVTDTSEPEDSGLIEFVKVLAQLLAEDHINNDQHLANKTEKE